MVSALRALAVSKGKTHPDSKLNYHWQERDFKEVSFKCQVIRRDTLKESLLTGLVESSQEARIDGSLDALVAVRERQVVGGGALSRRTPCFCVCAGGSQAGAGCGRIRLCRKQEMTFCLSRLFIIADFCFKFI